MERLRIEYPSRLPPQQLFACVQRLATYLHRVAGLQPTWAGDTLYVQGTFKVVKINAAMKIVQGGVIVEAEDPGFLWRGKAKAYLQEQLDIYLNPQTPVERLPS